VSLGQGRLDDAEAQSVRAEAIYREVLGAKHYRVARAHSSVADVYLERKDYVTAERMYKEALAVFREALPADHSRAAGTEIHIGRTLLLQQRYAEAEPHTLAGYTVLARGPSENRWLVEGRSNLVEIYEALGQPAKAAGFRVP
jgi:tetratricopeptide (TPR) repeat protein